MIKKILMIMVPMTMLQRKKLSATRPKKQVSVLLSEYWLHESMKIQWSLLYQILPLRMPNMGLQATIASNLRVFVRLINFWHNTSRGRQTLHIHRYLRRKSSPLCFIFLIPSTIVSPKFDGRISKSSRLP